jgi:hypothetical protein
MLELHENTYVIMQGVNRYNNAEYITEEEAGRTMSAFKMGYSIAVLKSSLMKRATEKIVDAIIVEVLNHIKNSGLLLPEIRSILFDNFSHDIAENITNEVERDMLHKMWVGRVERINDQLEIMFVRGEST